MNIIPKVIIQTGFSIENTSDLKDYILSKNPGYKYKYYNNTDCIKFISKHFNKDTVNAFNKLKPGAYKADLFRYCYLYINGGIYLDLDLKPLVPIDNIINNKGHFISCLERRHIPGIWQGFIACIPKLPFLKTAIDKIIYYTLVEYYPSSNIISELGTTCCTLLHLCIDNPKYNRWPAFIKNNDAVNKLLSITGPCLLYKCINFKKHPTIFKKIDHNNIIIYLYKFDEDIFNNNNKMIIENNYQYEMSGEHYHKYFIRREVYN